jgi:hypothetical protein
LPSVPPSWALRGYADRQADRRAPAGDSTNDLEARMTKLEKARANSAADDVAGGEIFR